MRARSFNAVVMARNVVGPAYFETGGQPWRLGRIETSFADSYVRVPLRLQAATPAHSFDSASTCGEEALALAKLYRYSQFWNGP